MWTHNWRNTFSYSFADISLTSNIAHRIFCVNSQQFVIQHKSESNISLWEWIKMLQPMVIKITNSTFLTWCISCKMQNIILIWGDYIRLKFLVSYYYIALNGSPWLIKSFRLSVKVFGIHGMDIASPV